MTKYEKHKTYLKTFAGGNYIIIIISLLYKLALDVTATCGTSAAASLFWLNGY